MADEVTKTLKDINATLKSSAPSEEERREGVRARLRELKIMEKMSAGIESMKDGLKNLASGAKKGLGVLGGIGLAGLMLFDPQKLVDGLKHSFDYLFGLFDQIKGIINGEEGSWGSLVEFLGKNLKESALLFGTLAFFFGAPLVASIGGMLTSLFSVISGAVSVTASMLAALGPMLVAAAPFIAIGALIAAGIYAIYEGFKEASEVWDETGSITESMVTFATSIVTAPLRWIKDLSAWVLGKLGFTDLEAKLNEVDITKTITDAIMAPINWVKKLFKDPTATLDKLKTDLLGVDGFITVLSDPVDKAINWILGLFGWSDPENPFSLTAAVNEPITKAIDWVEGLFKWGTEAGQDENGEWKLTTFITNVFKEVKGWFEGLFKWASEGIAGTWTSLTDFVKGKWTETKTWFTDMFKWSADDSDKGVIQQLFDNTIEKLKTFFTNVFDFIPTFEEIKAVLTSMLPSWMQPEAVEEQRARLENELAEAQANQTTAPAREDINAVQDVYTTTKEEYDAQIADIKNQLAKLPGYARGTDGFKNFGGGTLAMLHGNEAVVPLDTPKGQIYAAINDLLNNQGQMSKGGGGGGAAVAVVGGTANSNNTANVNNANYNISSGFTADEMVRLEFVNRAY